ncbi:hypothetical protein HAX54_012966, partial [Datura stramonium]|nr:hypothetical protein [Datura stramonium]
HGDALGMMPIGYETVGSGEMPMECQFELMLSSGHCFDPAYIGGSRIGTETHRSVVSGIYASSLLFLTDGSADTIPRLAGALSMLP